MGRLGTFRQIKAVEVDGELADEATVDFGASDVATALHASPAGVLSQPVDGDIAICVELEGGEYATAGYINVNFENPAAGGEVYLYARGGEELDEVAKIHIKASGEILVSNGSGNFKLASNGVFSANGHLTVEAPT